MTFPTHSFDWKRFTSFQSSQLFSVRIFKFCYEKFSLWFYYEFRIITKLFWIYPNLVRIVSWIPETVKFFNECYYSNKAGLGVWNAFIISLAHAQELTMFDNVPKPLNVFEDMPSTMVKTHATYWNAMVACSQAGETR